MEERSQSVKMAFGILYGKDRTMSFLPQLKYYLKGMGIIYTVRKYKMTDALVDVVDVGKCHRIPVEEIHSKEDLLPYVKQSGFASLDDWWNKIKEFIPNGNDPMYLYKVEVKNDGSYKRLD